MFCAILNPASHAKLLSAGLSLLRSALCCVPISLELLIRDLTLGSDCYLPMLHFFRAPSWSLDEVRKRWFCAVKEYAPLYKEADFHVLVGDGVKQFQGRTPDAGHQEAVPGIRKLCKARVYPWTYVWRPGHPGREHPQLGVHPFEHPAP